MLSLLYNIENADLLCHLSMSMDTLKVMKRLSLIKTLNKESTTKTNLVTDER